MKNGENQRIQELFLAALEQPADERESWLADQCGEDRTLLDAVRWLLKHDNPDDDPLENGLAQGLLSSVGLIPHGVDGLHVRCPHCRNPIELVDDALLESVTCTSCGSSFSLIDSEETKSCSPHKHERIAHFQIVDTVGTGAFGTVYRAFDETLSRTVAIKVPRKGQLPSGQAELFLREARTAAQLRHPNIVSVHEVGRDDDRIYIVSDFVDGLTLTDWLTGVQPTPRESAELMIRVAQALQHAHEHGVIHRDLKPSNIMLDRNNEPHLMDFGLAKRDAGEITMTVEGQIMGTPAYMSPEQARGEGHDVDRRADIYSLGVILFEMLTGERPFRGNTRMLLHQVLTEEAPSPRKLNGSIPKDLDTICSKCLEKSPAKRYVASADLASDLQRFLDHEPISARPVGPIGRSWRWCQRKPVVASLLFAVAGMLLATLGVSTVAYFKTSAALGREAGALRKANQESALAETARASEERQRKAAETALLELYETVGVDASEQGKHAESLLWFATAASASKDDDRRRELNLIRYRNWLRPIPFPVAAFRCELGQVQEIEFNASQTHCLVRSGMGTTVWDLQSGVAKPYRLCRFVFNPTGDKLAKGEPGGTVNVFSLPSMDLLQEFHCGEDGYPHLCFDKDSNRLAIGVKTVRIWDCERGLFTPGKAEHPGYVRSLSFMKGSTRLVTSCSDKRARVFDVASDEMPSEPLFPPAKHDAPFGVGVSRIRPLPMDDNSILLRDHPRRFRALDVRAGKRGITIEASGLIANAVMNEDRTQILVSTDHKSVEVYDARTGKEGMELFRSPVRVPGIAFQPFRNRVATASHDGRLRFWDLETMRAPYPDVNLQGRGLAVQFSPDGRYCAIAQEDGIVKLLEMPDVDRMPAAERPSWHQGLTHEPSVSGKLDFVARGGNLWEKHDDPIVDRLGVVSVRTLLPAAPQVGLPGELVASSMSPDGKTILAMTRELSDKGRIDQNTDREKYLAQTGRVTLWDWRSGRLLAEYQTESLPIDGVFSPDGSKLVVVCGSGEVLMLKSGTLQEVRTLQHDGVPVFGFHRRRRMIRFGPHGQSFVTFGVSNTAYLWTKDGDLMEDLPHESYVEDAQFSPTGDHLVTAQDNGEVIVWDVNTGEPTGEPLRHPSTVWHVTFDSSGTRVATAGEDKMARVWNWRQARLLSEGLEHSSPVRSVFFSNDGLFIVSITDVDTRFWHIESGRQISPPRLFDSHNTVASIDSRARSVVIHGDDSNDVVLSLQEFDELHDSGVANGRLLSLAELVSGRRIYRNGTVKLTGQEWLERWYQVKDARDSVPAITSTSAETRVRSSIDLLANSIRVQGWPQALRIASLPSVTRHNDPLNLAMRARIHAENRDFNKSHDLLRNIGECESIDEPWELFDSLAELAETPQVHSELASLLTSWIQSNHDDLKLLALRLLEDNRQLSALAGARLLEPLEAENPSVVEVAERVVREVVRTDLSGNFASKLTDLSPSVSDRLETLIEELKPPVTVDSPAVLALLGLSDTHEWTEPQILRGDVNTARIESVAHISRDRLKLFFGSSRPSRHGKHSNLWVAQRNSPADRFGDLAELGAKVNFASHQPDAGLTSDELLIVFASEDSVDGRDLWMATRDSRDEPFGEAVRLGVQINGSEAFEAAPSLSADGLRLVFSARIAEREHVDLYFSQRKSRDDPFGPATRLSNEINTEADEDDAAIADDGSYVIFRTGTDEDSNLYLTLWSEERGTFVGRYRLDDRFQSDGIDCAPRVTANEKTLFFSSSRNARESNASLTSWQSLDIWYSELVRSK